MIVTLHSLLSVVQHCTFLERETWKCDCKSDRKSLIRSLLIATAYTMHPYFAFMCFSEFQIWSIYYCKISEEHVKSLESRYFIRWRITSQAWTLSLFWLCKLTNIGLYRSVPMENVFLWSAASLHLATFLFKAYTWNRCACECLKHKPKIYAYVSIWSWMISWHFKLNYLILNCRAANLFCSFCSTKFFPRPLPQFTVDTSSTVGSVFGKVKEPDKQFPVFLAWIFDAQIRL